MIWFLVCLAAAVFGLIMYNSIYEEVPESIRFLKRAQLAPSTARSASAVANTTEPAVRSLGTLSKGQWNVRASGDQLEVSTAASQRQAGDPATPEFGVICYQGHPYVYLDPRYRLAAGTTQVDKFTFKDDPRNVRVFAAQPRELLAAYKSKPVLQAHLSYADGHVDNISFSLEGLAEVLQRLPPGCRS